jgi:MerR family mercuric resistance operon transcriptional regulator
MDTVHLVRFIKRVQDLGFSLTDIEQLLRLQDGAESIPADVLLQQMLLDVRARKRDLQNMDTVLSMLLSGGPSTYKSSQAFLVSALEPPAI